MRYTELLERAATATGISKYENHGETFYITHRLEGFDMVHCNAFVVGKTHRDPAREKVAVASCHIVDRDDGKRNNLRVYSDKSFVEPQFRRYGLLNAMYDHLERFGFVVYPANGEIGNANLQAQSDDAKAFWAKRQGSHITKKLVPATDAELHGWNSPWANADDFEGIPVIEKTKVSGYESPFLVLYRKDFAGGSQKVGVMYTRAHGYRCVVSVEVKKDGYVYTDMPWIDGDHIHFYDAWIKKYIKATTLAMALKIGKRCYPN